MGIQIDASSSIAHWLIQNDRGRQSVSIILKSFLRDQNLLHKNGPEALLLNDEHHLSRLDSSMHEELERLASSVKSDFDSHKGTLIRFHLIEIFIFWATLILMT